MYTCGVYVEHVLNKIIWGNLIILCVILFYILHKTNQNLFYFIRWLDIVILFEIVDLVLSLKYWVGGGCCLFWYWLVSTIGLGVIGVRTTGQVLFHYLFSVASLHKIVYRFFVLNIKIIYISIKCIVPTEFFFTDLLFLTGCEYPTITIFSLKFDYR